jgi:hypothetical protein
MPTRHVNFSLFAPARHTRRRRAVLGAAAPFYVLRFTNSSYMVSLTVNGFWLAVFG